MNMIDLLRISPFLNDCPNCSHGNVGTNEKTGEYHGSINIDENLFTRECRCGFEITIDAEKGTSKNIIKSQIDSKLKYFKKL